jgi:hypothetical protein
MRMFCALLLGTGAAIAAGPITTSAELVAAVKAAADGETIELAAGTFELDAVLELKGKTTLRGAGLGKTILRAGAKRQHSTKSLPDPEMRLEGLDTDAYLLRVKRDTSNVTICDLTLKCDGVHGAIFSWFHKELTVRRVRIENAQWSGIRTFGMQKARITECEFENAGGRWSKGQPGVKGGITGGGIFACWMADCEIDNNTFTRTDMAREREYYGIKVRQAQRCRVHHNTIEANFSMEFPFENDGDNELDHNVCYGTISIPKHAGGPVPKSGRTFRIHHNYFKDSYSIEFVRNGCEIDHNLFDFDAQEDHGNLIAGFGNADCPGPATFHNNLVRHPGRGVIWINEVFNNMTVRNNHVKCITTKTPRTEGLFGFNPKCDFKTISLRDNIFECEGTPRPLLRAKESYGCTVENNTFTNIADAGKLANPKADRPIGPEAPLKFRCGAKESWSIDGWQATPPGTK